LTTPIPAPTYPGDGATHAELRDYFYELEQWLDNEDNDQDNVNNYVEESGTGYFVSTFNDSEESKIAFTKLQELGHKLVYEADPRQNGNGSIVSIGIFLHKNAVARDAAKAAKKRK
jgi:hypothetical protein